MKILSVYDPKFSLYGKVIDGYKTDELVNKLDEVSPKPKNGTIYVPSDKKLESLEIFNELSNNMYGGMPIQLGYCSGENYKLNCLEYHRDSEINLGTEDFILLLGLVSDVKDYEYDTKNVEAFYVPANTLVEVYATTLHYAPCSAHLGEGFKVLVVLPKNTNTDKPKINQISKEDKLLFARNKWLLSHKDTNEAASQGFSSLKGDNIDITSLLERIDKNEK